MDISAMLNVYDDLGILITKEQRDEMQAIDAMMKHNTDNRSEDYFINKVLICLEFLPEEFACGV